MYSVKLTIAYKGTEYCGYQVQGELPTIAKAVQDTVEKIYKKRYDIKGSSRTDSGVHANGFVVAFKPAEYIPENNMRMAFNSLLPPTISVIKAEYVGEDFHPRYDSKGKRYIYKIWNNQVKNPFAGDLSYYYPHKLDEKLMDECAKGFIGTYDYSAFCASGATVEDKIRTVYRADVRREGEYVIFTVEGDGFLYNMVRIMAGTLIMASMRKLSKEDIVKIIESKNRANAGKTVPPEGLYLDEVFY